MNNQSAEVEPQPTLADDVVVFGCAAGDSKEIIEKLGQHGLGVRVALSSSEVLSAVSQATAKAIIVVAGENGSSISRLFELLTGAHYLHTIPVVVVADAAKKGEALAIMAHGADALCPPSDAGLLAATLTSLMAKQALRQRDRVELTERLTETQAWLAKALDRVIPIGAAATQATDFNALLERIVLEAMTVASADGGTLYLRTAAEQLEFAIMRTHSLNFAGGGTTGVPIELPPIPMFDPQTGQANHNSVATHTAHAGRCVNIKDVYLAEDHDFSGARAFDARVGYRTRSLLTVPLKDANGRVIGVLQLINATDSQAPGKVIAFSTGIQRVVEGLATLAAAVLASYLREQSLRRRVEELRIEVDQARKNRQVEEISTTDYFKRLVERAAELRQRAHDET